MPWQPLAPHTSTPMASQDTGVQNPERKRRLEAAGECPICIKPFIEKVYQCREGHVLCERCSYFVENCPVCRIPLQPEIRNRVLEEIGVLDPSEEVEIFQTRKDARDEELFGVLAKTRNARKELADAQKELEQAQRRVAAVRTETEDELGLTTLQKKSKVAEGVFGFLETLRKIDPHIKATPEVVSMLNEWKTRALAEALAAKKL